MILIKNINKRLTIHLRNSEANCIYGLIQAALDNIGEWEFQTVMGFDRLEGEAILGKFQRLLAQRGADEKLP